MTTFRAGFALPLEELRDEMDRLWSSLTAAPPLHGWGVRGDAAAFPAVNVRESDQAITVEAELPGLDTGDVDITVSGEELVLKGKRPAPDQGVEPQISEDGGTVTWHRRERGFGGFERRIPLPTLVDAAGVTARLADGVLTVTCPKAPESQPHKVAVRTGS